MDSPAALSVDDVDLLAHVDGHLSVERRAAVEAAITESPILARRLAALRASVLPYAEAFNRQAIPPLPQTLVKHLSEIYCTVVPLRARSKEGCTASPAAKRRQPMPSHEPGS
jgi:anti-sigma factor RsiW